jgi:hypothetical protein
MASQIGPVSAAEVACALAPRSRHANLAQASLTPVNSLRCWGRVAGAKTAEGTETRTDHHVAENRSEPFSDSVAVPLWKERDSRGRLLYVGHKSVKVVPCNHNESFKLEGLHLDSFVPSNASPLGFIAPLFTLRV